MKAMSATVTATQAKAGLNSGGQSPISAIKVTIAMIALLAIIAVIYVLNEGTFF